MPINKNAYARYRIIDDILNYKKFTDLDTLIEACERRLDCSVSERTIKQDLSDMKLNFDAPIEFDKYHKGYHYVNSFSMQTTIPLKSNDLSALHFAVSTLNQFQNIPILADFKNTVDKVVKAIKVKQRDLEANFIQFETTPYFKGSELLTDFTTAILEKRKVIFSYQYFDIGKESKEHFLHPYLLKEYRNRWYVIGFQENYAAIRTFGLDRIWNLEITEDEFEPVSDFNADTYFKHSLGITAPGGDEPQEIILLFDSQQGKYIETQPIHESQTTESSENGLLVKLNLLVTYELITELLAYGDRVKIIKPESLADAIKNRLKLALKNYE